MALYDFSLCPQCKVINTAAGIWVSVKCCRRAEMKDVGEREADREREREK